MEDIERLKRRLETIEADMKHYATDSLEYRILSYQRWNVNMNLAESIKSFKIQECQEIIAKEEARWRRSVNKKKRIAKYKKYLAKQKAA